MFYVYIITNNVNNFKYIGKECGKKGTRWKEHQWHARAGKKTKLHQAIRDFGIENFSIEYVFESCHEDQISAKEIELIKTLKTHYKDEQGYNMTSGSQGGPRKWDINSIKNFAAQYSTRTEWAHGHPSSYEAAMYRGCTDEVTIHMPVPKIYTIEDAIEASKRFDTAMEWKVNDHGTYDYACRKGILTSITEGMKKSKTKTGTPVIVGESCFFRTIAEAALHLKTSTGNISLVLTGSRVTVKGKSIRYATEAEIRENGLDTSKFIGIKAQNASYRNKKLILGKPLIDIEGRIFTNRLDAAHFMGINGSKVDKMRKIGLLRTATESELIKDGKNPADWGFYFKKKYPKVLHPRKKRRPSPSNPDQLEKDDQGCT